MLNLVSYFEEGTYIISVCKQNTLENIWT